MDSESLGVLQKAAAEAEGLPGNLSGRLRGDSYSALCRDARQALVDFGLAPPPAPARNERGQFKRDNKPVNDLIRRAAGFATTAEPPEQLPAGDVGVGRGGGAQPRQRQSVVSMNDLIRGTANASRDAAHLFAEQLASERGQ
jgi:hypothetical protein